YTNGIIDDEHFIDSEYSFGMQYQQGLLQEGTGVKPWPIDIWDKDESTVVNGLLKHMYYYGHNSDKPYHLRDIVKNAVEPIPFWKAIFPGSSASNSTGGKKVEIFGARVQWYVGIAGAFTTDGWKTSPANKILSMQAFSREGKSFVDGTPATIYTIVMFGGNGRDQLIYLNFLDKDAWNKTYNY
ncbi:MAG: hypothetical protein O9262_06980, partial [Cyclobacteriaceae bacterium]|nr:hypothetical protein [Cyclobacteriaceae bacterium]